MSKYDFDAVIERRGTISAKWDGMEPLFGTNDLFPMWIADMDFKAPPEILETLQERIDHGVLGYTRRFEPYREAVASWMERRHGWRPDTEWIRHTPGVVPALAVSMLAFTQPGDGILVQPPVYYPFFAAITGRGRRVVENPLAFDGERFWMDFEDLERKLDDSSVKMAFLCSPHNPGGRVWTREELEKFAALCAARGIIVISDEIHCDVLFHGAKHTPLADVSEEIAQLTISTVAPSKTFNVAGLATAAVIIPSKRLRDNYQSVVDFLHIDGGNVFGTIGLEAAYRHGDAWLDELTVYLEKNLEYIDQFLAERLPGIKLVKPDGTYVPLLDCRTLNMSGPDLEKLFVEKGGVALDGGHWFGTGGTGFARINIATPRSLLKEGLERIERAVKSLG
ncbi:MAG: pyridoxal phosphate-dependent aminotransferase [Synergistaceae bacterium]|nr:pyridoxal phosphate-dependent aminotransferase [Synergistaceae bacterium]